MICRIVSLSKSRCKSFCVRPRLLARQYATNPPSETITVPCQSNGSITLDLFRPLKSAPQENALSVVLAYLPRGPPSVSDQADASNLSILRSSIDCPIVRINYRLGKDHKYPTPIHDVLAGYEWILENLLHKRAITRVGRSETVGKIAVCGEDIGGGLAIALALTECRLGEPGIVAAAVSNPLIDWVSLDDGEASVAKNKAAKKMASIEMPAIEELNRLTALRREIFRKPEHYFDPFASPILFFRSAGVQAPPAPMAIPVDDLEQLSMLEREEFYRRELVAANEQRESGADDEAATLNSGLTQRKASRRYPSKSLRIKLPQFHISAGTSSPLQYQARELLHALRQSFVRQSKEAMSGSSGFGRKVLLDDEEESELDEDQRSILDRQKADAMSRAKLAMNDGFGWWDSTAAGRARMLDVAMWLNERLS